MIEAERHGRVKIIHEQISYLYDVRFKKKRKKMATAQGTPESDTGSFECFQNYTAPEVFIQGLAGIVDQQDVESMIRAQKQM